jgi:hypothetical protein
MAKAIVIYILCLLAALAVSIGAVIVIDRTFELLLSDARGLLTGLGLFAIVCIILLRRVAGTGWDPGMKSSEDWSRRRRIAAQNVASILYGVITIMTADLAVKSGKFGYIETGLGALIIGLTMTTTRLFVKVVAKETEVGAHLSIAEFAAITRESLWVMLFPAISVSLIIVGALATTEWQVLLDDILYVGMATVFVIGFLSSYILNREFWPALRRASAWLLLSVVIVVAKSFA